MKVLNVAALAMLFAFSQARAGSALDAAGIILKGQAAEYGRLEHLGRTVLEDSAGADYDMCANGILTAVLVSKPMVASDLRRVNGVKDDTRPYVGGVMAQVLVGSIKADVECDEDTAKNVLNYGAVPLAPD